MRLALVLALLAACGDNLHEPDYLGYDWDARRVVCSARIDDLEAIHWSFIDSQIDEAARGGWVLLLYAHTPTVTISLAGLEHVLARADADGLHYYTYRDLTPGNAPHAGLALSFDDNAPDQWMLARPLLNAHGARATFFVTHWPEMTDAQHAEIAQLHEDGDDIDAHTMTHPHAIAYVKEHGLDAYLHDEVLPSFQVLIDAGLPPPVAFAYPFGEHTSEIDDAILPYVRLIRTTAGTCPWAGWNG